MADNDLKKRRAPIPWRPPADRHDEFHAKVAESGLSTNAFITEAVFGRNRHRPAELKLLSGILSLGQCIIDALKALDPPAVRDAEIKALLEQIRLILIEIRSALLLLMGRKS